MRARTERSAAQLAATSQFSCSARLSSRIERVCCPGSLLAARLSGAQERQLRAGRTRPRPPVAEAVTLGRGRLEGRGQGRGQERGRAGSSHHGATRAQQAGPGACPSLASDGPSMMAWRRASAEWAVFAAADRTLPSLIPALRRAVLKCFVNILDDDSVSALIYPTRARGNNRLACTFGWDD